MSKGWPTVRSISIGSKFSTSLRTGDFCGSREHARDEASVMLARRLWSFFLHGSKVFLWRQRALYFRLSSRSILKPVRIIAQGHGRIEQLFIEKILIRPARRAANSPRELKIVWIIAIRSSQ